MFNYYVVTTERGGKDIGHRVGRGTCGEMTVTEWWTMDKRTGTGAWRQEDKRRRRGTSYRTYAEAFSVLVELTKR